MLTSCGFCRKIPGYPRVDRGNDYLMARFDGAVLDAQPWGRGDSQPIQETQAGKPSQESGAGRTAASEWLSQLEVRGQAASLCWNLSIRILST